jgi:hypothetical protein
VYAKLKQMADIPNVLRPLLGKVVLPLLGERRKASILAVTADGGLTVRR